MNVKHVQLYIKFKFQNFNGEHHSNQKYVCSFHLVEIEHQSKPKRNTTR